ncbi:TPA: hypothetical protein DCR49_08005 [Candidatus Delongbacteria bacterium]|nr:hypothetical protein [Candidatus Delongbacteria bacterium]
MKKLTLAILLTISLAYGGLSKDFYYEVFDSDGVSWFDFSAEPYDGIIAWAYIKDRPFEQINTPIPVMYLDFSGLSVIYLNPGDFPTPWQTGDELMVELKNIYRNGGGGNFNSPDIGFILDQSDLSPIFDGPSFGIGTGITVSNPWPNSIEEISSPNEITLHQNYPNPFNPETSISFSLPKEEQVTLSVFNSDGQLVKELVNCKRSAGNYSVNLNAENFNSGIYFYTLETGSTKLSKKMLLIK